MLQRVPDRRSIAPMTDAPAPPETTESAAADWVVVVGLAAALIGAIGGMLFELLMS